MGLIGEGGRELSGLMGLPKLWAEPRVDVYDSCPSDALETGGWGVGGLVLS